MKTLFLIVALILTITAKAQKSRDIKQVYWVNCDSTGCHTYYGTLLKKVKFDEKSIKSYKLNFKEHFKKWEWVIVRTEEGWIMKRKWDDIGGIN